MNDQAIDWLTASLIIYLQTYQSKTSIPYRLDNGTHHLDSQPQPRYYGKVILQQLSKDQANFDKTVKRLFNDAQAKNIKDTLQYIKQKVKRSLSFRYCNNQGQRREGGQLEGGLL